jgi:homospermidine synthase
MTIDNFVFIGCGMVATALLEVFNMEKAFYDKTFLIIEPEEIKIDLLEGREYEHIKEYVTEENHKSLLKHISDKTLIIDLSVELDSLMIIKYAKKKGALYINTSVENWESFTENNGLSNNYEDFKNNTLYHRELEVDNLLKHTQKTRLVNMGMNPGGINEYAKLGLKEYAKTRGKRLLKGNYAKLGHDLGLKKIVIAEYDSQETDIQPKPDTFYNTWSPLGAQSEFADYVMVSLNNDDLEKLEDIIIKPTDGDANTHIRFIAERGMDIIDSSVCLDIDGKPFKYDDGMLIPHAEIISMSNFFSFNGDAPTIFYCYRPSNITIHSTNKLRDNNYIPLEFYYGLENKDIVNNGFDSIGALMCFENGDRFWAGTVQYQDEIVKMGFKYAQATTVQVAGWIYAAIEYMLKYPNIGHHEPETLHSKELFKIAKKYQGKSYFKLL